MAWLNAIERRVLWERRLRLACALLVLYLLLALLDGPAYRWWHVAGADLIRLEGKDYYRLFRVLGTMLTWVLVAAALVLQMPRRGGLEWALRLLAAAGLAGLLAELLKYPIGRLRPSQADGEYQYLGLLERFGEQAHGGPSSHAAVAFGAMTLLGSLWPRTMPLMLLGAAGCAATRVVSGAHFLTDVYMGAVLGIGCAWLLRPRDEGAAARRVLLP